LRELNVAATELAAAPVEPEPIAVKVRKPRKRRAEQLPAHLPRREEAVEVPEGVSRCGIHGARQQIGEDVIETLVYVPAELYVRVQRLPKFACVGHAECGVASPARPVGLVEGNRYDTSIAAQIITAKYGFHLPIYRQQDLFSAAGWIAQRGTLLNILRAAGDVVKPFIEHLVKRVLRTGPVGTDDTTVTLLLPAQLPGIPGRNGFMRFSRPPAKVGNRA
jgi:transposase